MEDKLRQAIAKIKGHMAPQAVKDSVSDTCLTDVHKNSKPGEKIAGEGIFLGRVKNPKDREGNTITGIFNMFAAPEDLTDLSDKKKTFKYEDVVKRVKGLKNFHGHDGESYATDKEFYSALKKGTYKGGWIIPTREMLIGTNADSPGGKRAGTAGAVQPDNLYGHRKKGSLKNTFCTEATNDSDYPQWYWSCTENRKDPGCVWNADFSDGDESWNRKDNHQLSCRLVRLVPVAV